jgi:hypothetical protein
VLIADIFNFFFHSEYLLLLITIWFIHVLLYEASMLLLLCGERCWWTNGGIKWRTCYRVICWHDCQSVLRHCAPTSFCIVLLYFFLFSWFVLVVVSNNVLQAICLITCVSCICHRSKHLPWLVESHSGNQSHTELTVSTIAEIATFEPNFERLILVQRILMPANSQTLFVWASRRGCLRKRSITSCVQCQGTANSVPQDLLAIVGRVQRYCRS